MSKSQTTFSCPHCKKPIEITEAIAGPALAAAKHEAEEHARRELNASWEKLIGEERSKSIQLLSQITILTNKLGEAQEAQAAAIKAKAEADEQKREMNLIIEKAVSDRTNAAIERGRSEGRNEAQLKLAEANNEKAILTSKIQELSIRLEQGSQQAQGEILETEIEQKLKLAFPMDEIAPVPKGVEGGDITQEVNGPNGACGVILWELKRTKNWSDSWLPKLRKDQRESKADVAVIVSFALPKGVDGFGLIDGVWVVHPSYFVPLCIAVRSELLSVHNAKRGMEGMKTKSEQVYEYLIGARFKQRVSAIIEAFTMLKDDLDKEKKATTRLWAKREETLERVVLSTAGMYGDLQAIAGQKLGEIEGLSLEAPK